MDRYRELHAAIDTLSEIQKRRVRLYYFGRMTCQQIADGEKVSLNAVSKVLLLAENNLRKLLAS